MKDKKNVQWKAIIPKEEDPFPPHVRSYYYDDQGRRCTEFVARCESATGDNVGNARLIATSHKMLDLLKSFVSAMEDGHDAILVTVEKRARALIESIEKGE